MGLSMFFYYVIGYKYAFGLKWTELFYAFLWLHINGAATTEQVCVFSLYVS